MKVAVITPYHEPNSPYFARCLTSVRNQTYKNLIHVAVGDGCHARELNQFPHVHSIALPQRINNFGDSPRSIGVVYAFSVGADAVLFLDSDNWYADNHVERMVRQCLATASDVVTCQRYLSHLNGSVLGICPESDGVIFCDTNCLLVTKSLAEEAGVWWLIPDDLHVIDDRVIWDTLIHATNKISSTGLATVYYRTAFEFHYRMFGKAPPGGTKTGAEIGALGEVIDGLQGRAKEQARLRTPAQ